jgi:hypothetical protein
MVTASPSRGRPNPKHSGFLDLYYTPQSKSFGRTRTLVDGLTIRIVTFGTLTMASNIILYYNSPKPGEFS